MTAPRPADRLDALRRAGEGLAEFADRIGAPLEALERFYQGAPLDGDTLIAIATHAGVSIDWLLLSAGPEPGPQAKADARAGGDGPGRGFAPKSWARLAASHVMAAGLPLYDGQALGDLIVDCVQDPVLRQRVISSYLELKALRRRGKL